VPMRPVNASVIPALIAVELLLADSGFGLVDRGTRRR